MYKKLFLIDSATDPKDLKSPPGNRFHFLEGDKSGMCSISVNQQWRICFIWKNQDAYQAEIMDYH